MLEFLAQQAVRKHLQIVIATHSRDLTRLLPKKAIRVLQLDSDRTVSINTDLSADEAFHEIGSFPAGKTIIVEDERAKAIVVAALESESKQAFKEFNVIVRKGGAPRKYIETSKLLPTLKGTTYSFC